MKKMIINFFIFTNLAFCGLDIDKLNELLLNISSSKQLKFYTSKTDIKFDKKILFTSMEDADIILFPKDKLNNKLSIVDSFKELKNNKNSLGAIYIKKNRTQIIFIEERLKDKKISLPKKFNKYIVSKCNLSASCIK